MVLHPRGPPLPARTRLLVALARLCSDFTWLQLPQETYSFLVRARLIPLGKPDGGVRPIAIGELIRQIAAKIPLKPTSMMPLTK